MGPEYVFELASMVVPEPDWITVPLPDIAFKTVRLLLRLKTSVALSVTLPLPSVPSIEPDPICKVPELIVVGPE